ncbi:MAG: hypothetical protein F6J89_07775 [Symploca sp. SIO1C4]|uniref:DUF1574 domain-containing protein n=1 Tax=Symploca sp. SIO1C4 TaxID=2607765 RepID=A0A6B3NA85_9CYAN|nr:hypothetical protein [Symploca sp. SIO1C4]
MPQLCLRLYRATILALLTLSVGCSQTSLPNKAVKMLGTTENIVPPVGSNQPSSACTLVDPFTKAVDKAMSAATIAQSAQSRQEWDVVISHWIGAIGAMQAVPPTSPKRVFAQKKVAEYLKNLEVAQQKASRLYSPLPFTSFNHQILDEQLLLYLSYVAALGPPDVLIVGSSRALQGVDPQQLQQALASLGKGSLKIFNFGVNGATAQFVDFQLRQLLTLEQLPRLILWADGVRAFNSGRVDKTYESVINSQGYKRLLAGVRPQLPKSEAETTNECEATPETTTANNQPQLQIPSTGTTNSFGTSGPWRLTRVSYNNLESPLPSTANRLILTQLNGQTPQRLTLVRGITGYSSFAINANGFLPVDSSFAPKTYFQKHPRVAGIYDADYQPFSFSGQQAVALNSIKAFTSKQQIPLVIVDLPITGEYLDSWRLRRQQQFEKLMQQKVSEEFIFIDLAQQWLTQNDYFADPSHLNRYGAAAVSSQLAAESKIPWP